MNLLNERSIFRTFLIQLIILFCAKENNAFITVQEHSEKDSEWKLLKEIDSNQIHEDFDYQNINKGEESESVSKYKPNWASLDSRPLPKWYDESKIGIFIHWGAFSVPGLADAWFWNCWNVRRKECVDFMRKNYKPGFTYQDFAKEFTAEFFRPYEWADLFQKSGARYVVLTSKHHDGYTMWPSKYSFGWNSMDVGPKKDIVRELAEAIKSNTSLHFGLYHSLFEWYNPLYLQDKANNFTSQDFVNFKTIPELYEIVKEYQPEVIWSDGEWEAPDWYWNSTDFLAWLYNESPVKKTVVTNDRWGQGLMCKHGGFYTCTDRYNPGILQPRKWENAMTTDKESWAIRRNANVQDYLTPEELITTIIETVSCGGNILVNVGPTKEGTIIPIQQERLLQMGEWLEINGEAIYNSVPWAYQNDSTTSGVWYTQNPEGTKVYALMTKWPGQLIHLGSIQQSSSGVSKIYKISLLGFEGKLNWTEGESGIIVDLPSLDKVISKWAWTLLISLIKY